MPQWASASQSQSGRVDGGNCRIADRIREGGFRAKAIVLDCIENPCIWLK
jgi:hypothetical protein